MDSKRDVWRPLVLEWTRALRAENKSPKTIEVYVSSTEQFLEWLREQPDAPTAPEEIRRRHIRGWISELLDRTSPGNANTRYRSLRQWFNWLLSESEIDEHPMATMKPPLVPEKPVPVIPDDLVRRLLDDCRGRDFIARRDTAIIRLILDTGARLSEIATLTLDDVDLELDVIHVLGKGRRPRVIPFSSKTGQALSRYLRVRHQDRWGSHAKLWLAEKGRGPLTANGIKLMLRRRGNAIGANDEIGRNLHAHLGRHFMAHHWRCR